MSEQTATPTPAKDERGDPIAPVLPAPPVGANADARKRTDATPPSNGSANGSLPSAPTQRLEPVGQPAAESGRRTIRIPPRALIGGAAGVLAVALLIAVVQRGPAPERARLESFSSRGLTFTYLSTLHRIPAEGADELDVAEMTLAAGDADDASWREALAMGESDVVLVMTRDQSYVVDETNVRAYAAAVVARYRAAGIEVPRTRTTSVDGLPALSSVSKGTTPSGEQVQIRTTEIFAGGTVYAIVCQGAPGGRAELMAACDAILRSAEVDERRGTAAWKTLSSRSGDVRLSVPPGWQEAEAEARGTHVAASLPASAEGTTAARLEVASVRLRRPVPTAFYADVVADRMKRYLVGRRPVRIDGRPAEMLRFEDKDAGGVFYVFVEGRTAYAVRFDIPLGNPSFALLRPTMDSIAGTLALR